MSESPETRSRLEVYGHTHVHEGWWRGGSGERLLVVQREVTEGMMECSGIR